MLREKIAYRAGGESGGGEVGVAGDQHHGGGEQQAMGAEGVPGDSERAAEEPREGSQGAGTVYSALLNKEELQRATTPLSCPTET
eukprot:6270602-Pyramimonas_sp.AAC.1